MTTSRLFSIVALSCVTALAAPVWAEGKIDPVTMTGADGKPLSKGEVKAVKDFQMLDFNKDGKIGRKELMLVPKLYAGFDEADTNKDDYLTLDEVRAFAVKYRARRDAAKAAQATQGTPASGSAGAPPHAASAKPNSATGAESAKATK